MVLGDILEGRVVRIAKPGEPGRAFCRNGYKNLEGIFNVETASEVI
jgi:hypothetical protein